MKTFLLYALALVVMAAPSAHGVQIKTEVKIEAAKIKPDAKGAPRFTTQSFQDGELYYNAMPSTPSAGTAVKVIETDDDTDFICKIYTLTHNVGSEIREYLLTTVLKENGDVQTPVNTKTGINYLIVTAPVFQFPYLEAVIATLDQEGTSYDNTGDPSINYKMKHRLASDVARFIQTEDLTRSGDVFADDTVNVLYICDVPSYYRGALSDLKDFDVPPEMVRIEAEIVEIEMDDDFNFGLSLEAWKEGLPEEINMSFNFEQAKNNASLNPDGWARYAAQSIDLNGLRPKAVANFINYLVRKGKAKVLSRPTVVAMNGQEATIASLDNIDYTAYSTPDQPLDKQAQVGISLTITPIIGTDSLSLEIDARVHSLMGWSRSSTPIINTRSTTANVVLQDGELFTLSGLRKDVVTKMDDRVPILGSIPMLGYFFRHEIDMTRTSEIVVMLTPRKVTPTQGVLERERELLESTEAEVTAPPKGKVKTFIDKVILNK